MRELPEIEKLMNVDEHIARFISHYVFWKNGGDVFHAQYPYNGRSAAINAALDDLEGQLVSESDVYGRWRDGLTEAPSSLVPASYIIRLVFMEYKPGVSISRAFSSEVEFLETLSKHPHPNVCVYYGCIRRESYMEGICLQKYECDVSQVLKDLDRCACLSCNPNDPNEFLNRIPKLNHEHILAGILSSLGHIHALGLVHNNINPRNIVMDGEGNPITSTSTRVSKLVKNLGEVS
jgi:serine/threonine protein kinase